MDSDGDVDQLDDRDAASGADHGYFRYDGIRLVAARDDSPAPAATVGVHDAFRTLGLDRAFPCIGAKLTLRGNAYGFGLYDRLGCAESSSFLARDLGRYMRDSDPAARFRSFPVHRSGLSRLARRRHLAGSNERRQ